MDTGKSGLSRDDIILMAAEAKMAPSDLVPSNYEGILDSLTKFAEQVCKWQRERDADIVRDYPTTCGLPGWEKLFDGAADRLENAIRNG